ncbi:MAG: radical SAM protein [Candidatus Bathyarchaeota archaeon]|nr:radical SAM protein [Candidatus Termiticorpusculum sp.]
MTTNHHSNSTTLSPRIIAWESTRACNYACQHCRAQAQKQADPKQLTTKEAYNMIDQIATFCKPIFIISGGDPLQREDIFDIAKYASDKGLRVVMSPSGSNITPEIIEKLKKSGIKMISLSLDGSSAKIHDNFRMVQGAFDLVMHNMTLAHKQQLPFRINTTVTQHNLTDLFNIQKIVTDMNAVEWDIFMLVPTGRGKIQMELTPDQYEETLQAIYAASLTSPIPIKVTCAPQYNRIVTQHTTQQQNNCETQNIQHGNRRGCMAGNGFCFISHVGEVYGCGFLPLKAGNIRQQFFGEIYQNSTLFKQLRDPNMLKGKCGTCNYKTICGGCRARAFSTTQNYLQEEPYCKYNM